MKKLLFIICLLSISTLFYAQTVRGDRDSLAYTASLSDSSQTKIEKGKDTTRIRLGNKGITIIEKDGKTTVDITNIDKEDKKEKFDKEIEQQQDKKKDGEEDWTDIFNEKKKTKKFDPHYEGLEIGLNNYMTKNNSLSLPTNYNYLVLNTSKSFNININTLEYAFPVSTYAGFLTGVGFNYNNYRFDNDSCIQVVSGNLVSKSAPLGTSYQKSKLATTYVSVPLLFEVQIPITDKRKPLYFSFGVMGAIKVLSNTKEIYSKKSDDVKSRVWKDFNLNTFKYGFQAKVGYKAINLYANYYPMPMFKGANDPQLYSFDVGFGIGL